MGDRPRYELRVDVSITDTQSGFGRLAVSETVSVNTASFLEMAGILGQFHELAESIKKAESAEA
jgi:hypothetical protein